MATKQSSLIEVTHLPARLAFARYGRMWRFLRIINSTKLADNQERNCRQGNKECSQIESRLVWLSESLSAADNINWELTCMYGFGAPCCVIYRKYAGLGWELAFHDDVTRAPTGGRTACNGGAFARQSVPSGYRIKLN